MTATQAAEYLGYSVRTVYNLRNRGLLPYHKLNGRGRPIFVKEELDEVMGLGDRADAILNFNELRKRSK